MGLGMTRRGQSTAPIEAYVGARIRERRIMLGLTQEQLAELIGVTYQQMHKYERGITRVPAGRLFKIAHALTAGLFDLGLAFRKEVARATGSYLL